MLQQEKAFGQEVIFTTWRFAQPHPHPLSIVTQTGNSLVVAYFPVGIPGCLRSCGDQPRESKHSVGWRPCKLTSLKWNLNLMRRHVNEQDHEGLCPPLLSLTLKSGPLARRLSSQYKDSHSSQMQLVLHLRHNFWPY